MQYFFGKSDQYDQWNVLNLLTYNFGMKNNFLTRWDSPFKILTGKTKLDPKQFFERSQQARTRGHHQKLTKKRALHQARMKFFSHRVVSHWNALPEEVVTAPSINCFKNRLDQHWATRYPNNS